MRLHSNGGLAVVVSVLSMLVFGLPVYVGAAATDSSPSSDSTPPPEPKGPPPHGHRPPPEAYNACEGKTAGTAARLTTPRGDLIEGVCEKMDGKIVLIPDFDKDRKGPRPTKGGEE